MSNKCVTFIEGTDEYSRGTFDCGSEYAGCIYQVNGRCCYNVSTIKQRTSKACLGEYGDTPFNLIDE